MREEIQAALDLVRPQLQADGGDAEIVEVTEDGIVKLRLKGACGGCPGPAASPDLNLGAAPQGLLGHWLLG